MKTIIEQIDENKTFYKTFQAKERKLANNFLIKSLDSLIDARNLLPASYIDKIVGIPCKEINELTGYVWKTEKITYGMSYSQILNYVIRYVKTGTHLKYPYKISNNINH